MGRGETAIGDFQSRRGGRIIVRKSGIEIISVKINVYRSITLQGGYDFAYGGGNRGVQFREADKLVGTVAQVNDEIVIVARL